MNFLRLARACLVVSFFILCSSCTEFNGTQSAKLRGQSDKMKTAAAAPHAQPAYWHGDEVKGEPRIEVNLTEQRAFFYKGKKLVGESNISTGRKGFDTPPGKYRVIQKDKDHVSNLYGNFVADDGSVVKANAEVGKDEQPAGTQFAGAPMPFFLRFTRGYGMHAGFVPRYRASHGCIRMPREMAKHFFDAAELDTPVTVID